MPDFERIKLIVLDVDGTLTDGSIYFDSCGSELKRFDVKDGLGIKVGIAAGIEFAILTGRKSQMVMRRAEELQIQHLYCGVQIKYPALIELLRTLNIQPDECGYIGDDWNDLQAMEAVGFCACPADATEEVKDICHYVSSCPGGKGAVRDCIEYILRKRGIWCDTARLLYSSD